MTEVIPQVGGVSANPTTKAVLAWFKTQLGKADQVVEEWHEGSEWYRKHSNGFIEQGGIYSTESSDIATIAFNTPFAEAESVRVLVHRDTPFDSSQEWHSHFLAYNVTASKSEPTMVCLWLLRSIENGRNRLFYRTNL